MHYSTVAAKLGVSSVTAYEMLRLLEEKGLVRAEYARDQDVTGPGRSSVIFQPTMQATKILMGLAHGKWSEEEWGQAKGRILAQLRSGETADHEQLLEEILNHIPSQHSQTLYLTQMATAIALMLHTFSKALNLQDFKNLLRNARFPDDLDLSSLLDMVIGISLIDRFNRRSISIIRAQMTRFHGLLAELNEDNRRRLGEFTREVLEIVGL